MVTRFQSGCEQWLVLNEVPTCVQTYGGKVGEEIDADRVAVVVSGNPGISDFYVGFMKSLQPKCRLPVWVIGHAGHEFHPDCPSLTKRPELFNMAGQVKHKVDFITNHVPNDKNIILIGHSIGAKICVELMKNEIVNKRVDQVHLMYPCLEHIRETKNGYWFQRFLSRIVPVITFLTHVLLTCVPVALQFHLIRSIAMLRFRTTTFDDSIVHAMMKLFRPPVVKQAIFLAKDEMVQVQELDDEVYERDGSKMFAYYGQKDGWSPLEHFENLKERHPNVNATVMGEKFEHAFMVRCAAEMAEEVAANVDKLSKNS